MLKIMLFSSNSIWVFPWSFIVDVFSFILRYFLRFSDEKSEENGSMIFDDFSEKIEANCEQNYGEKMNCEETHNCKLESEVKNVCNGNSTSKYQFITGSSVCAFIEEPETMNFTVKEMFVISHEQEEILEKNHSHSSKFSNFPHDFDNLAINHGIGIDSIVDFSSVLVDLDGKPFRHDSCCLELNNCDELSEQVIRQEKTESSDKKENMVHSSISNSDDFWSSIQKYDGFLLGYGLDNENLYDKTSAEVLEDPETPIGIGDIRVDYEQDSPRSIDDFLIDEIHAQLEEVVRETEHERVESPYIELVPQSHSSSNLEAADSEDNEVDQDSLKLSELKELNDSENEDVENEDDQMVGIDVVKEQRELIRQMKKEMRQLKINGLPTILEESESPRVEQDLRPLKIDERIRHKDRMEEIQTFYRRYLDKMRKLDILSQQTMYAIGLLQLKNQDLALNKKLSVPVIKSLLAQNFWSNKNKKHETDPVQKLIKDLQRDLELAYVGQLCLSWEMLKWQHNKAEELQAHDPDGFRQHNQVAGDFQKFQVLLQRFTEDEPFHQGPRVQHYVKSRCNFPGLLQVPLIKDDPKGEWRRNAEDGISVKMLKEVIASSMRSIWDFLRADKDEVCAISLMGIHGVHQVILQDPSDADLLAEIRSSLQKKEKRLKDLVRSGNCIVKKFQKHQDQRLSHEMLVVQVELRLVSRVLSMPRVTTDQLLWCHKKLNKIDIIGRKIYLEYSFLLFPC